MSIVLQFYPNGEFTQGVDTSHRRKAQTSKERRHEPLTQECRDGYLEWTRSVTDSDTHLCVPGQRFMTKDGGEYIYLCEDIDGHHYAFEGENYVLADVLMNEPIGRLVGRGELTPLVHQSVESSPGAAGQGSERSSDKPSRKRLEGMTKNMARNIRNAAYLLEQRYGKDNISFLTLTLPSLSADDLGKCCERWDYLVDQFLKWLRKRSQKHHIELEYVYCTEIQTKRLQQRKEYAPHLHLLFRGKYAKKYPWIVTPKQCREAWASCISNVLGHAEFIKSALENLQRVRKSAARYLSKYLSKGRCRLPSDSGEPVGGQLRTQWGGMARVLSRLIRSCTQRIHDGYGGGGLGVRIVRSMDGAIKQGLVNYFKTGEIVLGRCERAGVERVLKVGSGCLSTPTYTGGFVKLCEYVERLPSESENGLVVRKMAPVPPGCKPAYILDEL